MTKFYVHYTVKLPPQFKPQYCTAGPYSEDEVLSQQQDISSYANVSTVFISEHARHPDKPKES